MSIAPDGIPATTPSDGLVRDLTAAEARVALPLKWGSAEPDVLPAWVAEMDFAPAEPIVAAIAAAVAAGRFGYPRIEAGGDLGAAYAGFARRHYGLDVDPDELVAEVERFLRDRDGD